MPRPHRSRRVWSSRATLLLLALGACGEVNYDTVDDLGAERDGEALLAVVQDATVREDLRTYAAVVLGRSVRDEPAQHDAWESTLAGLRDAAGGSADGALIRLALTSLNGQEVAATITRFLDQAREAVARTPRAAIPAMGPTGAPVDAVIADQWLTQMPQYQDLSASGLDSSAFSGMTRAEIAQRAGAIEVFGVALRSKIAVDAYSCGGTAWQVRYRLYRVARDGRVLGSAELEGSMPPRTIERAGTEIGGGVVVSAANCSATGSEPDWAPYFAVGPAPR